MGNTDVIRGAYAAYEVGDEPTAGPDLVDLLPAGHVPPGYLPVLRAYDYAGDEVTLHRVR